jgi:iron complex outermembrane recepter protein
MGAGVIAWVVLGLAVAAPASTAFARLPDAAPPDAPAPVAAPPAPLTAAGARAAENAVRQADDAFGIVVGREEIGIYDVDDVRGFSPVVAGNVRINGLYFDPVLFPSDRISGATAIRVGPTVFGSPFPSPTGIVDLALRVPGDAAAASLLIGADSFGSRVAEADAALPLGTGFSLGIGASASSERFGDATRDNILEGALIARWRPAPGLEIVPYASLALTPREDASPVFVPIGESLPPRLPRRRFVGPRWAASRETELNAGVVVDWAIAEGWTLKAGLFRSSIDYHADFTNLIEEVGTDGSGRQTIIADPPLAFASTSGEVRLSRDVVDGPRRHRFHASLRGRAADRRFGGADIIDLGPTVIGTPSLAPAPVFAFTEQERDRVRQWTLGLGYEGRWEGVGELSAGVQRSDYSKRIGLPGTAPVATDATPLLWNVNAAIDAGSRLAFYGGFVTGLEESGVAPGNAANRNEALPAIRTRQVDAGVRWHVADDVTLIAGGFEVSKPYFNLDRNNRFGELGRVINRGIEASIAGAVTPALSVVAGTVLLWPRVTGEAVDAGRVGRRPVGAVSRRVEASADWRPGFAPGLSIDAEISHRSAETATVSNAVAIPALTFVDLGGRYAFRLGGRAATVRLQMQNLFDIEGYELDGAGVYGLVPGRLAQAYLTVDF